MRSFLLVFYGNTGSSWLIEALGSDPVVFVPGFEPIETWAWEVTDSERLDWIRTVFTPPEDRAGDAYAAWLAELAKTPHFKAPPDPGFTYVGFKMHAHTIENRPALLKFLLKAETRIMLLERRNRIKHALSVYRHHEEGKSQFEWAGVRPPSTLDLDKFHERLLHSVVLHGQSQAFWDDAVAALGADAIVRVQYEDILDGPGKQATMERLSAFLGITDYTYADSPFEKATPDSLAAAVVNYEELVGRYTGTEFEQFLAEE